MRICYVSYQSFLIPTVLCMQIPYNKHNWINYCLFGCLDFNNLVGLQCLFSIKFLDTMLFSYFFEIFNQCWFFLASFYLFQSLPHFLAFLRYFIFHALLNLSCPAHTPDTFQSYTNRMSCGVPFQRSNPPQAESNCSTNTRRKLSDTPNIIVL